MLFTISEDLPGRTANSTENLLFKCFRHFFDEISSRALAGAEITLKSRGNTKKNQFPVKCSSSEGNSRYK